MALSTIFIKVTNLTAREVMITDISQGLEAAPAHLRVRPGPCYVPASGSIYLALDSSVLLSYEAGAIRTLVTGGVLSVSQMLGALQVHTFMYDLDTLGGTVAAHTLTAIDGSAKQLPACNMIKAWVSGSTAVASGGAATITVGTTADADGICTVLGKATYTGTCLIAAQGAQIHNGTEAAAPVATRTAATNVTMTVGTAALTAGKFYVHIEALAVL